MYFLVKLCFRVLIVFLLLFYACLPVMAEMTQPGSAGSGLATVESVRLSFSGQPTDPLTVAMNDQSYQLYAANTNNYAAEEGRYSRSSYSGGMEKWHKYIGYGTILMAGLTAVSSSSESFHEAAAYLTAGGAVSAVATGYLAHRSRLNLRYGIFTGDNLHIILGALGAAILTTAVITADGGDESSHSGMGIAGGTLMTLGVLSVKW